MSLTDIAIYAKELAYKGESDRSSDRLQLMSRC
jgi:hypothetical protein